MKTLSTRELRIDIGKLSKDDCPIIITNRGKEVFVLEDFAVHSDLCLLRELDARRMHRENQLLKEALVNFGKSPSKILQEAEEMEIETTSLEDLMKKLGLKTADEVLNKAS